MADSKTISLRTDIWFPYDGKPGSDKEGFMIDIAREVFEAKGYKIDYQLAPWSRAIKDTRKGKYDGIVGAFKEEAPDFVFPENECGLSTTVFITKKGEKWKYTGVDSLKKAAIGVIKGYSYGEVFDKYIKNNSKNSKRIQIAFGADAFKSNSKKLMIGRLTAFVEDKMVAFSSLKKMGMADKVSIAGELFKDNIYIAFSPNRKTSKKYAKILSDGMVRLRKSGKLKKILSKYGLKDWK